MRVTYLYILFISFLITSPVCAQQTSVIFKVDMSYQIALLNFSPQTEFVDVAGTFNEWGEIPFILTDPDSDGIYEGTANLTSGSAIQFKARINGEWAGREEFPGGGPNRMYTVEPNGLVEFWYNDDVPSDILSVQISSSSTSALVGDPIQFRDISSGQPTSWFWRFENGSPSTSTQQNPIVTFDAPGAFDVQLTIKNDEGEEVTRIFQNYVTVNTDTTYWWNDAVFYQVFVRSFYDSDNDGNGDFKGLIEKLDYLNDGNPATHDDLGITGIWLMPIMQSPSYHGYDVTDYRTVEEDYGTNEDFKAFISAAHERGIRVIIEFVMNHTAYDHPWFEDSRNSTNDKRDWYVWEENDLNWKGSWGQDVWHSFNGDYYFGVFWGGMPDLNYYNNSVKNEMFDVAKFWLEDMNVDGFRLDAVRILYENGELQQEDTEATFQLWRDFRDHYKSLKSASFTVGEAWTSTDIISNYVDCTGMDYCFEFGTAYSILNAVRNGNVSGLADQMGKAMGAYPYLQFGTFLTNHDMNRVMSELEGNEAQAKFAASLLLTLPGVPFIYYGEEIGMTGVKPDEDIRTPLHWNSNLNAGFSNASPWRPVNDDYATKNIELQKSDFNSLWSIYDHLIALRNQHDALRNGNYKLIHTNYNQVFSFLRESKAEQIIVSANASNSILNDITLSIDLSNLPPGSYHLLDLLSGRSYPLTVNEYGYFEQVNIGSIDAYSTKIMKLMTSDVFSATLQFQVDMRRPIQDGWFNINSSRINIISNLGESELSDADKDSIYQVTLSAPIGERIDYKYGINIFNDDLQEPVERSYKVREGLNVIYDKYAGEGRVTSTQNSIWEELRIFPIPAHQFLKVVIPQQMSGPITYYISDVTGKVRLRGQKEGGQMLDIDTSGIGAGIFILHLTSNSGEVKRKIIIQD